MKIFNTNDRLGKKVNFVDENNVFVGYDMDRSCCESAGWYIRAQKLTDTDETAFAPKGIESYNFDPTFFEEVIDADVDGGGMVRFRLTSEGKPDLFLHIYNHHNGYYGHGFDVKHSGVVVRSGVL